MKLIKQTQEHQYERFWDAQGYQIIDCKTCGFIHINPIPTLDDLKQFYQEKYYREVKPFPYKDVTEENIRKTIEWVNNNKTFQSIYEQVMQFNQTMDTRMLDIGCGNNLLSKYFQTRGWDVCAVEPNRDAEAYLRKFDLDVQGCTAEDLELKENIGQYSFVNIQFVLEHIREPIKVLEHMYHLLVPGGIIRVCVPNDFSEGQLSYAEYYHEKLNWVCLPDHINYFTFNSLSRLLEKTGFKEIYRISDFPLEILLLAGINYYSEEEERAKVGSFVGYFERSFKNTKREEHLVAIYEHLAQLGFGRSIFMYAIKE